MAKLRGKHYSSKERLEQAKEFAKVKIDILFRDIDDFIDEHIVEDEIDGIERTLVEFNYNDWIRFKKKRQRGK